MARQMKSRTARRLAVTDAFRQFVLDQLEALGDVTARAMFGGVGLYHRALFFGILAGDVLYLKVDDSTRGGYERAGSGPFQPYADRAVTMRYYAVPLEVLESADDLVKWARAAIAVASGLERRTRAPAQRASERTKRKARRRRDGPSR